MSSEMWYGVERLDLLKDRIGAEAWQDTDNALDELRNRLKNKEDIKEEVCQEENHLPLSKKCPLFRLTLFTPEARPLLALPATPVFSLGG